MQPTAAQPTVGDAVEPKPMLLEPKLSIEAPEQAQHHPEAPNKKRIKTNLQVGDTMPLPSDSQHAIESLLSTVSTTIHLGAYTKDGITRMSPDNQMHGDLLRVLNDTLRDQLGHKQFRWTSL